MTLNEFKTHMLLMGWAHIKTYPSMKDICHVWTKKHHIFQLSENPLGFPHTFLLFHNWNRPARGDGAESFRTTISSLEEALNRMEELS